MIIRYTKYFLFGLSMFWGCSLQAQFIVNNGISLNNSGLVTTNGAWTNDAGTTILNNGMIQTSEIFVNNGTLDGGSMGGFSLKFATDQNFRPGGSRMGFLTKEGAGVALVDGTLSIKDSLLIK